MLADIKAIDYFCKVIILKRKQNGSYNYNRESRKLQKW